MKRRYWLLALIGVGLGIGIPVIIGGRELLPVLARVRAGDLVLLLAMIFLAWNLNAGRVRLLAGGMGYRLSQRQALATIMATEFAICATPGGSGGPVSYGWLMRRLGLPTGRGVALYAIDQFFDMIFFAMALVGLAIYWLIDPADLLLGWQLGVLAMLLLGGLVLAWWVVQHYRRFLLATGRLLGRFNISLRRRRRLAHWALEFRHSLRLVRQFPAYRLWAVYFLCTGHWLLRFSILYFAVRGVGSSITWSYAFIVQMLSMTAGSATLSPGGSGGAEASGSLLLLPYMDAGTAAGAILVWRFATFYWYLIAGAPVFAMLAGRPLWRRLRQSAQGNDSKL